MGRGREANKQQHHAEQAESLTTRLVRKPAVHGQQYRRQQDQRDNRHANRPKENAGIGQRRQPNRQPRRNRIIVRALRFGGGNIVIIAALHPFDHQPVKPQVVILAVITGNSSRA